VQLGNKQHIYLEINDDSANDISREMSYFSSRDVRRKALYVKVFGSTRRER